MALSTSPQTTSSSVHSSFEIGYTQKKASVDITASDDTNENLKEKITVLQRKLRCSFILFHLQVKKAFSTGLIGIYHQLMTRTNVKKRSF